MILILNWIKILLLYAAVQSRCLLSLTGNRAYANRSQPLEQLSRFVDIKVPSDWYFLYASIHRNGITLPRWLGKLTFPYCRKEHFIVMVCLIYSVTKLMNYLHILK